MRCRAFPTGGNPAPKTPKAITVLGIWILVFSTVLGFSATGSAPCDEALKKMQKAKADRDAAQAAVNRADQNLRAAGQNLAAAVKALNAVAGALGAQGKATGDTAVFGRSASNPSFLDDPKFKAAKEAWQTARDNLKGAENKLGTAKDALGEAEKKYQAAQEEYKKCLEREKRLKDEELLLPPGKLKLDEKLDEQVGGLLKFSVRLGGGLSLLSGGDYNRGAKGMDAYREEFVPRREGTIDRLGFGGGAFLEGIYWFKPDMGLGLGIGSYGSKISENAFSDDLGTELIRDTITASLNVVPVTANFHYRLPICGRSDLDLSFGPGLYFGCFSFLKRYQYAHENTDGTFDYSGKKTALGFQAGIGVDYRLSDRISVFGQLTGRMTSLSGLSDEWSVRQSAPGPYEAKGTGYRFWVFDTVVGNASYATWTFGDTIPKGGNIQNAKEGSVGGSGFSLVAGASFRF